MTSFALRNVFQNSALGGRTAALDEKVFGKKLGIVSRLLGCQHRRLTRPFGSGETAYLSCLECGARKHFNPKTLETSKNFYCPPAVQL
jgi:hypothetical protein